MTDNYHQDTGEGADLYSVGTSRGCGGLGIWANDSLHVSRNFVRSRVLASGPIRLIFELDYQPWEAGGIKVAETKRVTLDAGRNFDRFDSTFKVEGEAPSYLTIAVGIAKHDGGVVRFEKKGGWLRSWEPLKKDGNLGCAVVAPPASVLDYKQTRVASREGIAIQPWSVRTCDAIVRRKAAILTAMGRTTTIPVRIS